MNVIIRKDYEDICNYTSKEIAEFINNNLEPLICLAAGDTLMGIFNSLVKLQDEGKVDLNSAYYVELDEWVGLDYNTKGSCKQVVYDNFYTAAKIIPGRIKTFNGKAENLQDECAKTKDYIKERGGIGLSVLGIGLNGHIGFNEPNCKIDDDCIVVPLDDVTKSVCHKYFGTTLPVEYGITLSLKALNNSKKIILLANGEKKAAIVKETVSHPVSISVPSTMLREHKDIQLVIDEPAAALL